MRATSTSTRTEFIFVPRTSLGADEARCNFHQVDRDALRLVSSEEARRVTSLMMLVYMALIDAPFKFRESEGVLRFAGEIRDGQQITAWDQLLDVLKVADGTAHKALTWMHSKGLIGYFAGKNGVGIRIRLYRAASSIKRADRPAQKNLHPDGVAYGERHVSPDATPLRASIRQNLDTKKESPAPEDGANSSPDVDASPAGAATADEHAGTPQQLVAQLRQMLEPQVRRIAAQTAAHEAAREGERTRRWFDAYGLPKVTRVAQREAYKIHKQQAASHTAAERTRLDLAVGRAAPPPQPSARPQISLDETVRMCLTAFGLDGAAGVEQALVSLCEGGELSLEGAAKAREALGGYLTERGQPDTYEHTYEHEKSAPATLVA